MINISNRLKTIADFILEDSSIKGIIDIGCDHALLDIYVKENKEDLKVFASDINIGPLEKARENIIKYSFLDKIEIIQADGIPKEAEKVDTLVISGMGMNTISEILEKDIKKYSNIHKLALSSNNKFPQLREKVCKLGFSLKKEKIVYEDGKYYIIMLFERGVKNYSLKQLYFGACLLNNKNEIFFKYFNYLKNKKISIARGLPVKYNDKLNILKDEIEMLTEEIG